MALIDKLTAIGDAIRAKTGESGAIPLAQMPERIASIETGGGSVDTCTVTVVNNTEEMISDVWCTVYSNGSFSTTANGIDWGSSETFYDVVKNSVMLIGMIEGGYSSFVTDGVGSYNVLNVSMDNTALLVNLNSVSDSATVTIN